MENRDIENLIDRKNIRNKIIYHSISTSLIGIIGLYIDYNIWLIIGGIIIYMFGAIIVDHILELRQK